MLVLQNHINLFNTLSLHMYVYKYGKTFYCTAIYYFISMENLCLVQSHNFFLFSIFTWKIHYSTCSSSTRSQRVTTECLLILRLHAFLLRPLKCLITERLNITFCDELWQSSILFSQKTFQFHWRTWSIPVLEGVIFQLFFWFCQLHLLYEKLQIGNYILPFFFLSCFLHEVLIYLDNFHLIGKNTDLPEVYILPTSHCWILLIISKRVSIALPHGVQL